ncbi:hypothetical protein ASF30_09870 [Leifsonia sp. Leaf264]|nr:hypothetical protein ASF30_09870 [Leifsonia sp. Leaf264]
MELEKLLDQYYDSDRGFAEDAWRFVADLRDAITAACEASANQPVGAWGSYLGTPVHIPSFNTGVASVGADETVDGDLLARLAALASQNADLAELADTRNQLLEDATIREAALAAELERLRNAPAHWFGDAPESIR